MQCPNCQFENAGGNFCVKCGTPLNQETAAANSNQAPVYQQPTVQPTQPVQAQQNETFQKLEATSKNYWKYFTDVIRNPYLQASQTRQDQFLNGIITFGLYFVLYLFFLHMVFNEISSYEFGEYALKPTLGLLILVALLGLFVFGALKMTQVQVSVQDVFARFGTMYTPLLIVMVINILLVLLEAEDMLFYVMRFLETLTIYILPYVLFLSFKKEHRQSVDTIYVLAGLLILTTLAIKLLDEMEIPTLITQIIVFSSFF